MYRENAGLIYTPFFEFLRKRYTEENLPGQSVFYLERSFEALQQLLCCEDITSHCVSSRSDRCGWDKCGELLRDIERLGERETTWNELQKGKEIAVGKKDFFEKKNCHPRRLEHSETMQNTLDRCASNSNTIGLDGLRQMRSCAIDTKLIKQL